MDKCAVCGKEVFHPFVQIWIDGKPISVHISAPLEVNNEKRRECWKEWRK